MSGDFHSTQLADLHVPVRIGGDAALFKGVMKILVEQHAFDESFIDLKTIQFNDFKRSLDDFSWKEIEEDSGIERETIKQLAALCAESNATIACWAMGLTQHRNGVAVIQEVVNLLLLNGHVGRPGAGFCPVRGHSNVQGDRTVGIWERPTEQFLARLDAACGITSPREHGVDVVEAIDKMQKGDVNLFFCMGGNFISATPDTEVTANGLNKVKLTVQVSTKLNRSHLVTGETALILPCLGRTEIDIQESGEQFVTVENSMGVVHTSRGGLKPASRELRSEPWIVASLASTVLEDERDWMSMVDNYDSVSYTHLTLPTKA